MKKIIILLFLICCAGMAASTLLHAQQREWLNVWQKDGISVSFKLSDQPKAHFAGKMVKVADAVKTVEWEMSSIARFEMGETPMAVDQLFSRSEQEPLPRVLPGSIVVSGSQPGTQVTVYSLDGKQLGQYRTDDSGCLKFSTSSYKQGVVVLKIGRSTYKLMTR